MTVMSLLHKSVFPLLVTRKRASRIPVSVGKTNQRKLEKLKLLHSPKKLSATKCYIKEQLFSPKPKEELFSPKQWLSFDEQNEI